MDIFDKNTDSWLPFHIGINDMTYSKLETLIWYEDVDVSQYKILLSVSLEAI